MIGELGKQWVQGGLTLARSMKFWCVLQFHRPFNGFLESFHGYEALFRRLIARTKSTLCIAPVGKLNFEISHTGYELGHISPLTCTIDDESGREYRSDVPGIWN